MYIYVYSFYSIFLYLYHLNKCQDLQKEILNNLFCCYLQMCYFNLVVAKHIYKSSKIFLNLIFCLEIFLAHYKSIFISTCVNFLVFLSKFFSFKFYVSWCKLFLSLYSENLFERPTFNAVFWKIYFQWKIKNIVQF